MRTTGIKSYSLPQSTICDEGEDCGTIDTQSSATNDEEAIQEEDGESIIDEANGKSPNENKSTDDMAHATVPQCSNLKDVLVENLTELHLDDKHEIFPTEMSSVPEITIPSEVSSEEEMTTVIEEMDELPSLYVGRIIGKGGEMIRDLQARSGCHIDVNQDSERGAPKAITYRGRKQADIDLAKRLVATICAGDHASDREELPLGRATMKRIQVFDSDVGRIIGRGGETIRKLQSESQARIQVDHRSDDASGTDTKHRHVTITGTKNAVAMAEEMISIVSKQNNVFNRHSSQSIFLSPYDATTFIGVPNWDAGAPANHIGHGAYIGTNQGRWNGGNHYAATETDIISCAKEDIGHLIGRKGATIRDLQRRSDCTIQINQRDCLINISGTRQGIDTAKKMLQNFTIERGLGHPDGEGRRLEQREPFQLQCEYQPQQGYPSSEYGMTPLHQQCFGDQPMMMHHQQYQSFSSQQAYQQYALHAPSPWRTATTIDGQMYYYNQNTLETRWDKPAEMQWC